MRRIILVVGIAAFLISWAFLSRRIQDSYRLPHDVQSLESYLEFAGEPAFIQAYDDSHLVVYRRIPQWHLAVNLPSSMPGYVFNREGDLVDWSPDPGDDGRFQRRWLTNDPQALSTADARVWVKKQAKLE